MAESQTFGEVIGKNVRHLRGDKTMDDLAQIVRKKGVRWTSGNVSAIESGSANPNLTNLLLLSYALGELHGRAVKPIELLRYEGRVKTGIRDSEMRSIDFEKWLETGEVELKLGPESAAKVRQVLKTMDPKEIFKGIPGDVSMDEMEDVDDVSTPTEDRIAKNMKISVTALRYWAKTLWGHGFEEERDRLSGAGASPQKKGRISRELKDQISLAYNSELERQNGAG